MGTGDNMSVAVGVAKDEPRIRCSQLRSPNASMRYLHSNN